MEGWGRTANEYRVSFGGDARVLVLGGSYGCINLVNILKVLNRTLKKDELYGL